MVRSSSRASKCCCGSSLPALRCGILALLLVTIKLSAFWQLGRFGGPDSSSFPQTINDWQLWQSLMQASSSSSSLSSSATTTAKDSTSLNPPLRGGRNTTTWTGTHTSFSTATTATKYSDAVTATTGIPTTVASSVASTNNLGGSSKTIPAWMKDYLTWHAAQLQTLNVTNWNNTTQYRYLVLRCLLRDYKCGGASDRLKPIPFAMRLAYDTKRILLVDWERPARLEEFLIPPLGGLNWSVPYWLKPLLPYRNEADIYGTHAAFKAKDERKVLVDMRHQSHDHGSAYYNSLLQPDEPNFDDVYSDVWKLVFQPSNPVAERISNVQARLGLIPHHYASVHVRALYANDKASQLAVVENAVRCGTQLFPGAPLYVASDSANVTSHAVLYGTSQGGRVVTASQPGDPAPLHIDRGSNFLSADGQDWNQHNASDFYDTFVDLFVLAHGACTTFNVGGYGRWASAIGPNRTCAIDHSRHRCVWTAATAVAAADKVTHPTANGTRRRL